MTKNNFFGKAAIAMLSAALFFTACNDDPEVRPVDAIADVFIQQITKDGESKSALVFWAFGNQSLDTVTVEGPNAQSWSLEKDASSSTVFSLYPEEEDYTAEFPTTGTYKFYVSGKEPGQAAFNTTDELGTEFLGAMLIDSVGFNNSKLTVNWSKLDNVEAYMVRLYDASDELIFLGPRLTNEATKYSFGQTDEGWSNSKQAKNGETYRLELVGIRYEAGTTAANKEYNVQFVSIAPMDIVWND